MSLMTELLVPVGLFLVYRLQVLSVSAHRQLVHLFGAA